MTYNANYYLRYLSYKLGYFIYFALLINIKTITEIKLYFKWGKGDRFN